MSSLIKASEARALIALKLPQKSVERIAAEQITTSEEPTLIRKINEGKNSYSFYVTNNPIYIGMTLRDVAIEVVAIYKERGFQASQEEVQSYFIPIFYSIDVSWQKERKCTIT